jgi:hypothetical protein
MDVLDAALRRGLRLSLALLLSAQARLSVLMLSQHCVSYDDLLKSLCIAANQQMPSNDLIVHAGIVYEAIFVPAITKKGVGHKLHPDTIGNDQAVIDRILKVLIARSAGSDYPCIEDFKRDAYNFLQGSHNQSARSNGNDYYNDSQRLDYLQQQQQDQYVSRIPQELLNRVPDGIDLSDDYRSSTLSRIECEKSEPIVRLLAQVRKVGMDILFPQIAHDKVRKKVLSILVILPCICII